MPEDPAATAPPAEPAAPPPEPAEPKAPEDKPLGEAGEKALDAWKERAKKAESKAKELEPLAAKAREAEEANKSELEKANSKVSDLTDNAKSLAAENLRLRVALDKKLPPELIDRLKGDSQEEIEADAAELLKLVKPSEATDFGGGARDSTETKSPEAAHADLLLKAFGRT